MRKKKAMPPANDVLVSAFLPITLDKTFKLIVMARKAVGLPKAPTSIKATVEDAISNLSALIKGGQDVPYVPLPRFNTRQVSYRVSSSFYRTATLASKKADIRLADFFRTAIYMYCERYKDEGVGKSQRRVSPTEH